MSAAAPVAAPASTSALPSAAAVAAATATTTPQAGAAPTSPAAGVSAEEKPVVVVAPADKPADTQAAAGSKPAAQTAEFQLKLPDGVQVDKETLAEFTAWAKKANVQPDAASELAAWHYGKIQKAVETDVAAWTKRGEDWATEAKKDPGSLQNQLKAIRKFGGAATSADSNELTDALNELGIFYHPAIRKFASAIGAAMREDSSAAGTGASAQRPPDPNDAFRQQYPTMFKPDGSPKW